MRRGFDLLLAVAAVLLSGSLCLGGQAKKPPAPKHVTLFQLGTPDGLSAEFGGTRRLWPAYQEVFPEPIVFQVGKSRLREWPYIHPSNMDTWAGGTPHTFTIKFTVPELPKRPLHFVIGLTDTMGDRPPLVTVGFNERTLKPWRPPHGTGRGAFDPRGWHKPSSKVFPVPGGAIRQGENVVTIHCETKSWIVYDYIRLGTNPKAPKLTGESEELLEDALAGPLAGTGKVVFALRQAGVDGHWYANFGYYAPDENRKCYRPGGKLCVLDLKTGKTTVLLDDPQGGVRDPQVHYDGHTIVFSYRKGDSPTFHLYEIQADGSGLRQITDGQYNDIEPTYLADDSIIFCSERGKRWVNCWLTPVAILYKVQRDGSGLRMISSNNEHDNTPWPLPDGRVCYTRWEYVDRSQVHYHHLWVVNPDGTEQMVYYGNLHGGTTMIDAKPVPGTRKVIASFSPGHGRRDHDGRVTIIDPDAGPDARPYSRPVSRGADFRDPYALSEELFLVARHHEIVLMNERGVTQTVYRIADEDRKAGLQVHEPRPLAPRPRERSRPSGVDLKQPTGQLILVDAAFGRNMDGVQPGEIKKLLVLETLPKPINFTGGMEPLSYGGTFTLERVLGTVPVEPDGSAYMELPALRSLFFVALDKDDLAVKRMQSFVTVQPGETTSCAGCHENRTKTPTANTERLQALKRPPSRPNAIPDVPDVLDFPRDIQPILDKHCVTCHDVENHPGGEGPRAGGVLLTGDRGPLYSHSYFTLSALQQLADGRNRPKSNYPPRALGSGGAPLMKKILEHHHDVKLSPHETKTVRLWLDVGAPYPGTYAALGTGMVGGYAQNRIDRRDTKWPEMQAAHAVLKGRCNSCHGNRRLRLPDSPSDNMGMPPWAIRYGDPRLRFSRHILYNLTRPEKSLQLLAPLARAAGGLQVCKPADKNGKIKKGAKTQAIFASTEDPDYIKLLAAIRRTKALLDEMKRFDMPGFRPRPEYVREMKRYGILPQDVPPDAPLDPYHLERQYWKSLWYWPQSARTARTPSPRPSTFAAR
jgi:hypothetical protein